MKFQRNLLYSLPILLVWISIAIHARSSHVQEIRRSSGDLEGSKELWPLPKPQWAQQDAPYIVNKDAYYDDPKQRPLGIGNAKYPYPSAGQESLAFNLRGQVEAGKLRMYWNRDGIVAEQSAVKESSPTGSQQLASVDSGELGEVKLVEVQPNPTTTILEENFEAKSPELEPVARPTEVEGQVSSEVGVNITEQGLSPINDERQSNMNDQIAGDSRSFNASTEFNSSDKEPRAEVAVIETQDGQLSSQVNVSETDGSERDGYALLTTAVADVANVEEVKMVTEPVKPLESLEEKSPETVEILSNTNTIDAVQGNNTLQASLTNTETIDSEGAKRSAEVSVETQEAIVPVVNNVDSLKNVSHEVWGANGQKIDLADYYGPSRQTTWSPPGHRIGKKSKVLKVGVGCDETSNEMKLRILLDEGFKGVIYAEGHFDEPGCKLKGEGIDQELIFKLPLDGCGTLPKTNRDVSWYENKVALLFQQDQELLSDLDRIYHLRCLFKEIPASDVASHITVDKPQPNVITGITERKATAHMKIVLGGDPTDQSLDTFRFGTRASMVVYLDENSGSGYNFFINQCYAHDGKRAKIIPLFDDRGCPEPNNVMGIQKRSTLPPLSQKAVYSHFVVFKFPDSESVYFDCKVAICGYDCEMPKCNGVSEEETNITKSAVVKRDTVGVSKGLINYRWNAAQSGISVSINPDNVNILRSDSGNINGVRSIGYDSQNDPRFLALVGSPNSIPLIVTDRFCLSRTNMAVAVCILATMLACIVGLISYVCMKHSRRMDKIQEKSDQTTDPNHIDIPVLGTDSRQNFLGSLFKASNLGASINKADVTGSSLSPQGINEGHRGYSQEVIPSSRQNGTEINERMEDIGMNNLRMIQNRFIVGHHIQKSVRN